MPSNNGNLLSMCPVFQKGMGFLDELLLVCDSLKIIVNLLTVVYEVKWVRCGLTPLL